MRGDRTRTGGGTESLGEKAPRPRGNSNFCVGKLDIGGRHLSNPADKVERWSIDRLVPYARNARTHSDEQVAQIAASIKEWGWTTPVLVDPDGQIIAGHGRVMAARKLGLAEVPVMVADGWTDAQKRAYVLADNKLALNAGWDKELLALELSELKELGSDLDLIGFSEDELAALVKAGGTEGLTDPDEAPDVPANPVTMPGDVWVMGDHRLLCGDSTSIADLERLCAGQRVDMWLTDPPYNVAYEGGTKEKLTIKNDSMGDEQFRQFLRDAYTAADAVMKAGAVFYIWHADSEGYNFRGAARDAGWSVRQCLIWKKSSLVLGRQDYQWQHEPCLYGWKDGAEYQLLNNTKGGDLVLDSFGGSGTTLIAAEKNGRVARLMELDPKYCDVIVTRWQAFAGKHAHLESDGRTFTEVMGERSPGTLVGNQAGATDKKDAKKDKRAKAERAEA